jgi:hypothetical protein
MAGYTASVSALRAPFVADSSTAGVCGLRECGGGISDDIMIQVLRKKWILLQRFQKDFHPR